MRCSPLPAVERQGQHLSGFISELRRRKVFRVVAAYVVASWLLLQVADVLSSILTLPDWAPRLVFYALAIGLVPAILLAWAYELTAEGVRRERSSSDEHAPADKGFPAVLIGLAVIAAAGLGAGLLWIAGADDRWLRDTAMPQLEERLAAGDWEGAFATATEIESKLGEGALPDEEWEQFAIPTSFPSEPSGATLSRRPYEQPDAEWQVLGRTPLYDVWMPKGFSVVRYELDGHEPVVRVVGAMPVSGGFPSLEAEEHVTGTLHSINPMDVVLELAGETPRTEVRVPGTQLLMDGAQVPLADFHIGRYEVTNREYQEFVEAGGYTQRDLWEFPFVLDGRQLGWEEAMAAFTDSTGRPGPSTWVGGAYPQGTADHPVGGISWYEAAAYARFAKRALPTIHHWRRAHAAALITWQAPASNVETGGTAPVGEFPGIGWTGTWDMMGNVREWCANELDDQRVIVGGAWDNVLYAVPETISAPTALPAFDRSPQNGLRLADLRDNREASERLHRPIEPRKEVQQPEPVSDEVFAAFLRNFEYGTSPLNPKVEATEEFTDWTRHLVSFDDAATDDRIELLLYIPRSNASRHRVVLYWPTGIAQLLPDVDTYRLHADFLVRSGWAVALPVFEGTFNRIDGPPLSTATVAGRDRLIRQVREMRRTIDYLETRPDLETDSLVYYGFSWGAVNGALALAVEPRLKVGVLNQAGLDTARQEDIKIVHYLPRVRQPVLQFSGRYDTLFRYEDIARPFFEQLGSVQKKHVVEPTGHFCPYPVVVGETLAWLDQHLGL